MTLAEQSAKYGAHPNMISTWKLAAISNMSSAFDRAPVAQPEIRVRLTQYPYYWVSGKQGAVHISMDGKGRFLDNIFVERLWRSLKYECVYLHAWETGSEAKAGVGKWTEFYNHRRPHSALGGNAPAVVYWLRKDEPKHDQQAPRVA